MRATCVSGAIPLGQRTLDRGSTRQYRNPFPATVCLQDFNLVSPQSAQELVLLGTQHTGQNERVGPVQSRENLNQQIAVEIRGNNVP